jgi:hypothetical protein
MYCINGIKNLFGAAKKAINAASSKCILKEPCFSLFLQPVKNGSRSSVG